MKTTILLCLLLTLSLLIMGCAEETQESTQTSEPIIDDVSDNDEADTDIMNELIDPDEEIEIGTMI